jgi:hypothetical protein
VHNNLLNLPSDLYIIPRVKVTLDLGAGPLEILSNRPIVYGQWHELIIDRRGYYITVVVRSEEGQVVSFPSLFFQKLPPWVRIQKPVVTYDIVSYYRKAVRPNLFAALPIIFIN